MDSSKPPLTCVAILPGVLLLAAWPAAAQQVARVEAFFGYAFARVNSADRVPSFNANGGNSQFLYNFRPWFGFVADFGGYHSGSIGDLRLDTTVVNFQFGPRISWHKRRMVSPYAQALFGGAYASSTRNLMLDPPISGSASGLAMLVGGGVDIRIAHRVSVRPAEVDYWLTRLRDPFASNARTQNNLRYSAGISFKFGRLD
jgi:hypothetical protein